MACLLKAPDGTLKGCVVFTTQERDTVIKPSAEIRERVAALKRRYVLGLHHNWHDYAFHYDPLFDFSMAGDGDLIEVTGRDFARVPLDACNFAPPCYSAGRSAPFWDILYVARAVAFKGIPEFFQTIRALYDSGKSPRVLFICPMPNPVQIPGIADLRGHFETLFSRTERERITFLTLDWDYPYPFDTETLAYFYRSSKTFFHPAPDERRCRTAAYAWAGKMPVICGRSAASILPARFQHAPFLFQFDGPDTMLSALVKSQEADIPTDAQWNDVAAEFSAESSARRLSTLLDELALKYGWGALSRDTINITGLDIRLGRHHGISVGKNRVEFSIAEFCNALTTSPDSEIREATFAQDPELELCSMHLRKQAPSAPDIATNENGQDLRSISKILGKWFRT